ncbi:hypothetical protein K9M42_02570 [Patescibacteria group bacterium]|nr:hypothetical protein [Patescibacteria group bacterium]
METEYTNFLIRNKEAGQYDIIYKPTKTQRGIIRTNPIVICLYMCISKEMLDEISDFIENQIEE